MKLTLTHPLSQVVLTSIVTIAVSVGCSVSRSTGSPTQPTDNPTINQSSPTVVSEPGQESPTCKLSTSQAPVLKGLRLGMTPDEVLGLFPGSKDDAEVRAELARTNQFGTSSVFIRPSKYGSKEMFAEITHITARFLDGRLSTLMVGYNGPEWSHVDEFVTKISEGSGLPAADQWKAHSGLDNQLKILQCTGFELRVYAGGAGGAQNYVQVQDSIAEKTLRERREKARGKPSPTPGNQ